MCTDKFIGRVEEEQMRSDRRLGKSLAELEAKWEEKLQSKQNAEVAKGKVADAVVVSATTEQTIANWMNVDDTAAACVIRGKEKVKEEVAAGADAGTTCATGLDPIFSFHGDPLLVVDINDHRCWLV